jgi:hypothetical protein
VLAWRYNLYYKTRGREARNIILLGTGDFKVKYSKYTAIASLVFTIIPFISALISSYITLPLAQEFSFKVIMTVLFIISWFVLAHIVTSMPDGLLQRLKLIKTTTSNIQGYWLIEYEENRTTACSILEICDNCGNTTASKLKDFKKDLSAIPVLGIQNLQFNGDEQLSQVYAKGNAHHSFIRFEYKHMGQFDITRIDDNGSEAPSKKCGECYEITTKLLRDVGICNDEKIGRKTLGKFALTPLTIEQLLVNVHKSKNTTFAQEVVEAYSARVRQGILTSGFRVASGSTSTAADTTEEKLSTKKEGK